MFLTGLRSALSGSRVIGPGLGPGGFAAALGGVSLGVFVAMALAAPEIPFQRDAVMYHQGAVSILGGRGYRHGWDSWQDCRAFFPVGYSGFLAGVYAVTGPKPMAALLANAVLAATVVVLSYSLARRLAGEALGRLAAIAFALLAVTMRLSQTAYSEPLFMALFTGSVVVACRRPTLLWAALAGIPLGLAHLVRSTSLGAPLLVLVILLLLGEPLRRAGVRACLVGLVSLCVLAPWTLRNWNVFGRFVPVSTNGGFNLWVGNNPKATGAYQGTPPLADVAAARDEVERDELFKKHAMDCIRADPGRFLALMPAKVWYAVGFGFCHAEAVRLEGLRKVAMRFALSVVAAALVAAAACQGAWAAWRMLRDRSTAAGWGLAPLLVLLYFLSFVLVFHGQRRFLYPAYPFMALSMAWLVAASVRRLEARRRSLRQEARA